MAICKYYVLLEIKNRPAVLTCRAACFTVGITLGVGPHRCPYPHPRCKDTNKI